jgi:hypothetical protein
MATEPQPPFVALTVGTGLMTCGFNVEMFNVYSRYTTLSGINRDNVESYIADPAGLAVSIESSLNCAMKLWWTMSKMNFICNASTTEPDNPDSGSLDVDNLEYILPSARVCSPSELRSKDQVNPDRNIRYAVAASYRNMGAFVKYLYKGQFIGWGMWRLQSTTLTNFVSIFAASAGVETQISLAGHGNDKVGSGQREYKYAYVEFDDCYFLCEATKNNAANADSIEYTLNCESTGTIESTVQVTYELQDGSGVSTNTASCKIDPSSYLEFFTFTT